MYGWFNQNFDFNLRRDHQKIPYEGRDYESVDDKLCPEKWRENNSDIRRLMIHLK